jgi:pyruvate, orthophosphate dikinase
MTWVYASDARLDLAPDDLVLLLGGKAANIATMAVELGLPVPPACTISTEACRAFLASGWPDGLDEELRVQVARLEERVGRRFGDPTDPLLVSVRSGAPRSMPGMMDTILNLGLNEATEAGLAAASGDEAFAHDCRERFRAIYRSVVGVEPPEDPWQQLRGAIEAVFRSWTSDRAATYRRVEGIPDDLGTGVTIQAMVFGNLRPDSGTGVLFTRNPATGEDEPYGDVLFNAQGEDVVAGTHPTEPIAVLDTRLPAVAAELRRDAGILERHYRDCCDIEFTIERGRLWLLQVRVGKRTPQAAVRMAVGMAEDPAFPLTREEAVSRVAAVLADPPTAVTERGRVGEPLTKGLGVSPGLVSGEVRVTAAGAIAASETGADVILVRPETSPDDVAGMERAVGILTATGGFASHAAVVARGWGKPAVVGASQVRVGTDGISIDGRSLGEGTILSIDGATGDVFEGLASGVVTVVPEAKVLLGWARELGIRIGESDEEPAPRVADGTADEAADGLASAGDALRALLVKGYAQADQLGHALGLAPSEAQALLDELVADGTAEAGAGAFRLTAVGREQATALIVEDRQTWGTDAATGALDAFLDLDQRMKAVVTDWQTRGPETLNDHTDAAYDAAVLARLADLHHDVEAWLAPLAAGLPRLTRYGARLGAAAEAAAAGNGKYVASPRVDSYHGAWFELHEDLILLAGRTRADEVAAGRA